MNMKNIQQEIKAFYIQLGLLENRYVLDTKLENQVNIRFNHKKFENAVSLCFTSPEALPLWVREKIANLFSEAFPAPLGAPVALLHPCD